MSFISILSTVLFMTAPTASAEALRVRRRPDSNIDSELAAIGVLHAPLIIILISQMFLAIDCARSISRQVLFRSNRNGLSQIHI